MISEGALQNNGKTMMDSFERLQKKIRNEKLMDMAAKDFVSQQLYL